MQKLCYSCDREVHNYSKKYFGHGYCSTCAARLFTTKPCAKCGQLFKLLTANKDALCTSCIKQLPCARCSRIGRPIGKITEFGFVCNSCAVHFRKIELCERCHQPSQKLSKISRFNDNLRVCEQCATRDHQTCPSCRKYRLLISQDSGPSICKKCLTLPPTICAKCKIDIPAGCGALCNKCTWDKILAKRIDEYSQQLPNKILIGYYKKYGVWLGLEVGPQKAALSLKKHLYFFIETAQSWQINATPTHEQLLQALQPSELKTFKLPVRWLKVCFNLQIDEAIQKFHSEQAQITKLINRLGQQTEQIAALCSYKDYLALRLKQDRIQIRSIRLAIKPATELLFLCQCKGVKLPNNALTMAYLSQHPSHYAALTGFINFLNENYGTGIEYLQFKHSNFLINKSKQNLENKIIQLITTSDQINILTWAKLCLRYFHQISYQQSKMVKAHHILPVEDGYEVQIQNRIYWLPKNTN